MGEAFGLYTHIRNNKTRSVVLIAGLFLLVYVLVFAFTLGILGFTMGEEPLGDILDQAWRQFWFVFPWATIAALAWSFIGYASNRALIDAVTGAKGVTRVEEPRLYNLLENLCISRGMTTPTLQIIETDVLNAFASGMSDKSYRIAVTRGLVDTLNDQELEAVLAHELTHIRNGDVRLMVIAVVIAGVVTLAGELVFRIFMQGPRMRVGSGRSSGKKGGGAAAILIALLLIAVAWFLSLVIRFALSRSREYLADAGAVELTKNPDAMISALRKIENRAEMPSVPSGIMEMCIENQKNGIADLFSTHPSVAARVKALVKLAGGHDPGVLNEPGSTPAPSQEEEAVSGEEPARPAGPWDRPG